MKCFVFCFFPYMFLCHLQQGCTKGLHNSEKPPEPVKPEVKTTSERKELAELKPKFQEHIIRAPKPVETINRPRYGILNWHLCQICFQWLT